MTTSNRPLEPLSSGTSMPRLVHSATPALQRDRLLRLPQVEDMTGCKKSTLYALIKAGRFPRQIVINRRMSCWSEADVLLWIQGQKGGQA